LGSWLQSKHGHLSRTPCFHSRARFYECSVCAAHGEWAGHQISDPTEYREPQLSSSMSLKYTPRRPAFRRIASLVEHGHGYTRYRGLGDVSRKRCPLHCFHNTCCCMELLFVTRGPNGPPISSFKRYSPATKVSVIDEDFITVYRLSDLLPHVPGSDIPEEHQRPLVTMSHSKAGTDLVKSTQCGWNIPSSSMLDTKRVEVVKTDAGALLTVSHYELSRVSCGPEQRSSKLPLLFDESDFPMLPQKSNELQDRLDNPSRNDVFSYGRRQRCSQCVGRGQDIQHCHGSVVGYALG